MQNPNNYDSPILSTVGCSNLVDYLLFTIKKYKDNVAQIEHSTNRNITFKEIITKTQLAAHNLNQNGIKSGDVVTVCSVNNIDYCWLILAILNTGASCSLITPHSKPRELNHILSITKPKAIIAHYLSNEQLQVMQEIKCIKNIWMVDPPVSIGQCKSLSDLFKESAVEINSCNINKWSGLCPSLGSDAAFILSSSGSTGLPKGVILTHNNLITMLTYSGLFMKLGCTAMGLMPFYHAYGLGLMLMALHEGCRMVVLQKFELSNFISTITSYKITHLHIVPSLLTTLAKCKDVTSKTLSSVEEVFTGAGAVLTKHQRSLLSKLPPSAKLYHSYGMTETTFVVLFGECNHEKPGSAGKLLRGITAKIISENGEELKSNSIGELCLRGNTIMAGYLDNLEATLNTIDQQRWLHTGDLVYYDDDGYFFIVDRIKEMIKYQGYQVSPTEIELVLLNHAGVSEVAVIGIHNELYGEVPKAYVVKNHNGPVVTEEDLQNLIKEELSSYKQLRGGVQFVDSLPNSPTGKIQKKYLKELPH